MQVETRPVPASPLASRRGLALLTGAALPAHVSESFEQARAQRRPLSLVFVRSLHRGDLGPAQHAAACLAELNPAARVGVYDRHALLVVLPDSDARAAQQVARTLSVRLSGRGRSACGIASYPEMAASLPQLLGAAERASRRASAIESIVVAPSLPKLHTADASDSLSAHVALEAEPVDVAALGSSPRLVLVAEPGSDSARVAGAIHGHGDNASGPFLAVNCAAMAEGELATELAGGAKPGLLEQARGGTLFIDAVEALSEEGQRALGTALASAASDVRWIVALPARLAAGEGLGRDLTERLQARRVALATLRERPEQVLPLAERIAAAVSARWGLSAPRISDEARQLLAAHDWPGNQLELRHVIERAVSLSEDDTLTPSELPDYLRYRDGEAPHAQLTASNGGSTLDLRVRLIDHEAMLIRQALQLSGGNQRKASTLLNLPLRTFERKLRMLGGRERLMAS